MNLPNKLTLFRIILTPIFMVALMVDLPFNYFVAMLIFIVASITDMLDGTNRITLYRRDGSKFPLPCGNKLEVARNMLEVILP